MLKKVFCELREHAPFTFLGAITGILLFFFLKNIPYGISYKLFYTFHPLHVLLSAFVTTSMYKLHKSKPNIVKVILVGFIGSVGVATLSDSIFPFIGETILHFPHKEMHIGFIEKWYIVDPIAFLGIALAMWKPSTKFTHSGHVFLSTWASLFHIMMSLAGMAIGINIYFEILVLLFLAVWLPCCFSDIVFPLLFVKGHDLDCPCHCHKH